ncbi:MAG: flagellin [Betaproteobacteria bacterium]|nr:flagellin [Betaproteobacteria bacterium]
MSNTVINTNIQSLSAQRILAGSGRDVQQAMTRLASGLRINNARDDAAGLAIAERFTTQVRGLTVGIRNLADGLSLSQTAEGGLDSITTNLQRIRELAVQSANFTNSDTDRASLQAEVSQLRTEIDRVANQTNFNGRKLLDGSMATASFQGGANVGEAITVTGITSQTGANIGVYTGIESASAAVGTAASKTISVNGATALAVTGTTATDLAASINALGLTNVYASVSTSTVNISYSGAGNIVLTNFGSSAGTTTMTSGTISSNTVSTVDLSTVTGANKAILSIDAALATVNSNRATLGAISNRFEQAISAQRIALEGQSASRSRIQDADFAQETAALTRAQILQQSGMAILSQANSAPQSVLSLLR